MGVENIDDNAGKALPSVVLNAVSVRSPWGNGTKSIVQAPGTHIYNRSSALQMDFLDSVCLAPAV